jgi:hypothetical protein
MEKIEQTLIKIKEDIKPLLIEIFPAMEEEIKFACEDNFQEWFGMLFELQKWLVHPSMIAIGGDQLVMQTSKLKEARAELIDYDTLKDYDFISVVLIKNELHLIDGYHRVLKARDIGISQLRGCVWNKAQNVHPNCGKIKQLIINNL